MSHVIGIDLGGSKIAFGLVGPRDEILARRRIDTRSDAGLDSVVERIAAEVEALAADRCRRTRTLRRSAWARPARSITSRASC